MPPILPFAVTSLTPALLLGLGAVWGGGWPVAALVYMTVLAALLDQILPREDSPGAAAPAGNALLAAIALVGFGLLPLTVWSIAGGAAGGGWQAAAGFIGCGLWLGQVAVPAAHELIHRSNRWLFRLGAAVYTALLFGHHASAHRLVHHRHAASADDPNTARSGEGYYAFALRAWIGSFRQGRAAEDRLRTARAQGGAASVLRGPHPYAVYVGGAVACLALAFGLGGLAGVAVWAGLALHAQSQLLLSDYVQHYGLMRATLPDGKPEPIGPRHSWNAPHWFSSRLMLHAPRHSDHHSHPGRPFADLRLPSAAEVPHLPWPLPLACVIALVPPVWKRSIRPHVLAWRTKP